MRTDYFEHRHRIIDGPVTTQIAQDILWNAAGHIYWWQNPASGDRRLNSTEHCAANVMDQLRKGMRA